MGWGFESNLEGLQGRFILLSIMIWDSKNLGMVE